MWNNKHVLEWRFLSSELDCDSNWIGINSILKDICEDWWVYVSKTFKITFSKDANIAKQRRRVVAHG